MSETKLSNEVMEPMTKGGSTDNQASTEAKAPESTEAAKPEDVSGVICCACCVAGATFVACLPCYIAGVVVRCVFLPCKCVSVFFCQPQEKVPVPVPESTV